MSKEKKGGSKPKKDNVENKKSVKIENNNIENKNLIVSIIIIISLVIILLIINIFFGNALNIGDSKKDISKVKKIINEKYNEITCINENCDYVVAISGNGLDKTVYTIFSINGKKITQFDINYSKSKERSTGVVGISKKFLVTQTATDEGYNYSIRTLSGKVKYSSTSPFTILNDEYAIVKIENDMYSVINYKGKTIYTDVKSYKKVDDGKFVFIKKGESTILLNSNNKVISEKYDYEKEIFDDDNELEFLIVKNIEKDNYNYFSVKKEQVVGNAFVSYMKLDDDSYSVTDKKGNSYYLMSNGKQNKMSDSDKNNSLKIFEKISKSIDEKKYYVYNFGVKDVNQTNMLVKNKDENSFGTYNLGTKKYKKIFDFKSDNTAASPIISDVKGEDNIVKINCTDSNCDKNMSYIINLDKSDILYEETENNTLISSYSEYKNNYKLIKYSYLSSNEKLSGKYILLDDNNKEILKSDNAITVLGEELLLGEEFKDDLVLYSSKNGSKINSDDSLATRFKLNENIIYRYINKDKTIIVNNEGEEVIKTDTNNNITYSNSNIICYGDKEIVIYNLDKSKEKSYKLKSNDKLNDENGNSIAPYRGTIFINNTSSKKVKILNSKANVLRKINNVEISEVKRNEKKGIALIIVKKANNDSDKYGLYIAK